MIRNILANIRAETTPRQLASEFAALSAAFLVLYLIGVAFT